MKTFKSFIQLDEVEKLKLIGADKLAPDNKVAEVKPLPADLAKLGSVDKTKEGQGKRKTDKLDTKQPFGEELHPQAHQVLKHIKPEHHDKYKPHLQNGTYKHDFADRSAVLKAAQRAGHLKEESIAEAELSMQQTKMAHTIGKEFDKKKVGDMSKGGPYAVATAMVKNKPEAAQKAYSTIKSKMKEDADIELLFNLYDQLDENNQKIFLNQLEEDVEVLLAFAKTIAEE